MKKEAITVNSKYIFIDVVNYTYNRSVEAQTDIITVLNKIVKGSLSDNFIKPVSVLYIPTGDGMCITLMEISNPYDIHLKVAISILERLEKHNNSKSDEMRQFELRIGINENIDNLIVDINGNKNIAGSGINYAARILSLCDPNQILVSASVFDKLVQREEYMNSFTSYIGKIKHDISLEVYQFIDNELNFLNNEVPSQFQEEIEIKEDKELSRLMAYYFSHCITNEEFCAKKLKQAVFRSNSLIILNFFLAETSLNKSFVTKTKPDYEKKISDDLEKEYDNINKAIIWMIIDLAGHICKSELELYSQYFENEFFFINKAGREKLIREYKDIAQEFGIG